MSKQMSEAQWQGVVIALARTCGWMVQHSRKAQVRPGVWATSISGDIGFPDLVLVRDRVLFIELKTETGKLTKEQITWGSALAGAGADWQVWRPRMLPHITAQLRTRIVQGPRGITAPSP